LAVDDRRLVIWRGRGGDRDAEGPGGEQRRPAERGAVGEGEEHDSCPPEQPAGPPGAGGESPKQPHPLQPGGGGPPGLGGGGRGARSAIGAWSGLRVGSKGPMIRQRSGRPRERRRSRAPRVKSIDLRAVRKPNVDTTWGSGRRGVPGGGGSTVLPLHHRASG